MSDLTTIIYVSSAVRPFIEAELEQLLAEAAAANKRNLITGVLLYCDGNFMQCIEGPELALLETYDRIAASKRHKGLIQLLRRPIQERSFASWEMGFSKPSKAELLTLSNAIGAAEQKNIASDGVGVSLLKTFLDTVRKF